ncbi:MAG: hypothetical protein Unbinned1322contig1000_22 [Prokaryotic dsDNA virus sp.]|nr:hypothetical protein [Aequorivita sp.]QDP57278.1 MAG: hypothetical protein Unbinned1322contig1000_22 [Prokaryotic dsDNA virus sp.]|tara:strand:+ start:7585 stop:8187 length:603 start_codon:yes stop_codon:yes gene_type:complete
MSAGEELLKEISVVAPSLRELDGQINSMNSSQRAFCIRFLLRRFSADAATFDMTVEANKIMAAFKDGSFPGQNHKEVKFLQDWTTIRYMDDAGFWLAKARDQVVETAWNKGESHLTSKEIISTIESKVEGSQMSASSSTMVKLVNSILRISGFYSKPSYRKHSKDRARCWRTEKSLEECLRLLNSKMKQEVNLWEHDDVQ